MKHNALTPRPEVHFIRVFHHQLIRYHEIMIHNNAQNL